MWRVCGAVCETSGSCRHALFAPFRSVSHSPRCLSVMAERSNSSSVSAASAVARGARGDVTPRWSSSGELMKAFGSDGRTPEQFGCCARTGDRPSSSGGRTPEQFGCWRRIGDRPSSSGGPHTALQQFGRGGDRSSGSRALDRWRGDSAGPEQFGRRGRAGLLLAPGDRPRSSGGPEVSRRNARGVEEVGRRDQTGILVASGDRPNSPGGPELSRRNGDAGRRGSRSSSSSSVGTHAHGAVLYCFKVLAPEPFVGAVLSPKTRLKDMVQEETGCRIVVSERNHYYPETRLRIMLLFNENEDGILRALQLLLHRVIKCAEQERITPSRLTAVPGEMEFAGRDEGTILFRAAVTVTAAAAIIGPRGLNVQKMRTELNCRTVVDMGIWNGHQLVRVQAPVGNMPDVLATIHRCVMADARRNPEFRTWAQVRCFEGPFVLEHGEFHQNPPRRRSRSPARRELSAVRTEPPSGMHRVQETLRLFGMAASQLPEGAIQRDHCISCHLRADKVDRLIGRHGAFLSFVERETGAQIHFEDVEILEGGLSQRTLVVQGPLLNAYRAHLLMMKRYHEEEGSAQAAQRPFSGSPGY